MQRQEYIHQRLSRMIMNVYGQTVWRGLSNAMSAADNRLILTVWNKASHESAYCALAC